MGRKPRWGWVAVVAVGVWLVASPSDSDEPTPEQPTRSVPESGAREGAPDDGAATARSRGTRGGAEESPRADSTSGTVDDARRGQSRRETEAPATRRSPLVTRVIDGDTVELDDGEHVRLVGIDTPERGECGFDAATAALSRAVLGRHVRLRRSDEDRDGYGRLLRYVDVGSADAGLGLVRRGLAIARYDSRDGYGFHPREPRYVAADRGSRPRCPAGRAAAPAPPTGRTGDGGSTGRACEPGYRPCVPPAPPDLDCADVVGPVRVTGSDPHGLDGDGDGTACE